MIRKYSKTFVKNACALEEKLHGLNVPAAFADIRSQRKVNTARFYTWLFTKYSDYPQGVTVTEERSGDIQVALSAKYCSTFNTFIHCLEDSGHIQLYIDSKIVTVGSHMFLDVFADMCYKVKEHVEQLLVKEAQELLSRAKTLQLKSPFVQVFLEEPNYEALPKAKPVLMLERKQFDTESGYVHIKITKAQAEAFKKMQSL